MANVTADDFTKSFTETVEKDPAMKALVGTVRVKAPSTPSLEKGVQVTLKTLSLAEEKPEEKPSASSSTTSASSSPTSASSSTTGQTQGVNNTEEDFEDE